MTKTPKPLTRAERQRRVAQQALWCVVDVYTGKVLCGDAVREEARDLAYPGTVVERVDLRVKGVRA